MGMFRIVSSTYAPPQSVGKVIPWIFGTLAGVPAIPLRVPVQCTLTQTVDSDDTEFFVDNLTSLALFPVSGSLEIEGERVNYSGKDTGNISFTGITRGVDGTAADDHQAGVKVFEQLDEHVYGFFHNPTGHEHQSIGTIYLNGIAKAPATAPTHVVTVADTAAITSAATGGALSVGTVRFDMSTTIPP